MKIARAFMWTGVAIVLAILLYFVLGGFARKAPSPSGAHENNTAFVFSCDGGKTITATFRKSDPIPAANPGDPPTPTGSVSLVLPDGKQVTLKQTLSADGVRYANSDDSFVFWIKGDSALVQIHGSEEEYANCAVKG